MPADLPRREVRDDDDLLADELRRACRPRRCPRRSCAAWARRDRPCRWSSLSFFGTAAAGSDLADAELELREVVVRDRAPRCGRRRLRASRRPARRQARRRLRSARSRRGSRLLRLVVEPREQRLRRIAVVTGATDEHAARRRGSGQRRARLVIADPLAQERAPVAGSTGATRPPIDPHARELWTTGVRERGSSLGSFASAHGCGLIDVAVRVRARTSRSPRARALGAIASNSAVDPSIACVARAASAASHAGARPMIVVRARMSACDLRRSG